MGDLVRRCGECMLRGGWDHGFHWGLDVCRRRTGRPHTTIRVQLCWRGRWQLHKRNDCHALWLSSSTMLLDPFATPVARVPASILAQLLQHDTANSDANSTPCTSTYAHSSADTRARSCACASTCTCKACVWR